MSVNKQSAPLKDVIKPVTPGQPLSAEHQNRLIDAVNRAVNSRATGFSSPAFQLTAPGFAEPGSAGPTIASSSDLRLIRGQATADVTGGANFSIDNIVVLTQNGKDPRDNPDSDTEAIAISNTWNADYSENDSVLAIYNQEAGVWENTPSPEQVSDPPIRRVELKVNKDISTTTAIGCWFLSHSNARLAEVSVEDKLGMFQGVGADDQTAPPSNPGSGRGTYGYAAYVKSPALGESPAYTFVALDSYPQFILAASDNDADPGESVSGLVHSQIGYTDNHSTQLPVTIVTLADPDSLLEAGFRSGRDYLATLTDATTDPPTYQALNEVHYYMLVRGVSSSYVEAADPTFNITNLVVLTTPGTLPEPSLGPGGVLEVTNVAGLSYGASEPVEVIWNPADSRFENRPFKELGCGLKFGETAAIDLGQLRINSEDIAGKGLRETDSQNDCEIEVKVGCGLKHGQADGDDNGAIPIELDVEAIKGSGLTTEAGPEGCTLLAVEGGGGVAYEEGCGIDIVGNVISFDPRDVVGDGLDLVDETCRLEVYEGCGIKVDSNGVHVDIEELAGDGFGQSGSASGCPTMGAHLGCGLDFGPAEEGETSPIIFDAGDVATHSKGSLEASGEECGLKVKPTCEIKSFEKCKLEIIDGDPPKIVLKVFYRKLQVYAEDETGLVNCKEECSGDGAMADAMEEAGCEFEMCELEGIKC